MTDVRHLLVVVVTHESERVVGPCVAAIERAIDGAAKTWTVVVADNASTDGTVAVVRRVDPSVVVLQSTDNRGYAAGINAALDAHLEPLTDAVLVLNPDIRLDPGAVGELLDELDAPDTGIVVPRLVDGDGRLLRSLRREPTVLRAVGEAVVGGHHAGRVAALGEVVMDDDAYERRSTAAWATGAAMLVGRTCLDATGRWDESFFLYSEETDFCLRARDAGFVVRYRPSARAVHLGGESNTSPELWSLLTRNRVRLYRRRHGRVRGAAFATAVLLNEAMRSVTRRTSRAAVAELLVGGRARTTRSNAVDGVVCFSAQDWWYFSRGHSDFQLMTRVARSCPVLLVNSLGMRMPVPGRTSNPARRVARKVRSALRGCRAPLPDVPGFHVYTPLFLPVYGDGVVARANQRLVLAQIRREMRCVGISNPAVVVTLPTAWPVARRLERGRTIAYRSDRYSALPEADGARASALERDLLAHADIAVFASAALLDAERPLTRRAVLLRHGVDLDTFRPASEVAPHGALRALRRPCAGFVGMIDAYTVDVELFDRLAAACPDIDIVLAGPVEVDLTALLARSNVHHVGVLPFAEVPAFVAGLDVALMPWQQTDWIRFCNPVKLKEYLAVGVPVVSTDFPEARPYADVITIAAGADDFVAAVRAAAFADHDEGACRARRAAVAHETWDVQAARLVAMALRGTTDDTSRGRSPSCAAS